MKVEQQTSSPGGGFNICGSSISPVSHSTPGAPGFRHLAKWTLWTWRIYPHSPRSIDGVPLLRSLRSTRAVGLKSKHAVLLSIINRLQAKCKKRFWSPSRQHCWSTMID